MAVIPNIPPPYGVLPTDRQIRHHARKFYGFLHFTINTFTGKEWGFGDESPQLFNPTDFDADAIAGVARDCGMSGLILTCKHHDGFCLWPTATTAHSVAASPFRDGKGDVVREISDACRRADIEFGVYLSPWDRNHPLYGTPEYVTEVYRPQLRELLTNYGNLFEVWFDGANGGDGYYGGARETRHIDARTYYGWPETWAIVRELQPDAVMFSDAGPDVRWIGNEDGIAGDPCWATMRLGDTVPGHADHKLLNGGDRDGDTWLIPECDVSIRPGWFWHESETSQVRSVKNLVDLYFQSVGRGGTFLLNLPPDRRGRIPDADMASLRGFREHLDAMFANYQVLDATISPPSFDGTTDLETIITLPEPRPVNIIAMHENLSFGQRVDEWAYDVWDGGDWKQLAAAQSIGACRLARFPEITADRFRLRLVASERPVLSHIAMFLEPEIAPQVVTMESRPLEVIESATVTQPDHESVLFDRGNAPESVAGVIYYPYAPRGHVADRYSVSISDDGEEWLEIAEGEFSNILANPIPQTVLFDEPRRARFVLFQGTRYVAGDLVVLSQVHLIRG